MTLIILMTQEMRLVTESEQNGKKGGHVERVKGLQLLREIRKQMTKDK